MGGLDATAEFRRLVEGGCEPLDRVALAISANARRDLDTDAWLAVIDELAASVPDDPSGLCAALFGPLGFRGDRRHYHDPRNSFLDRVLERRRGIPILLSVLAMEVGRRRGVELVGIGMPGHFLVRDRSDPDAFFDPFGGGVRLDAAGCRDRFRQLHPAGTAFAHGYLEPVPSVRIVTRILGNLTNVYLQRTDLANLTWVLRLRTFLPGARPEERRQLAGVLANRGVFWEAADEYEVLAGEMPERAERYRDMATRLRARRN